MLLLEGVSSSFTATIPVVKPGDILQNNVEEHGRARKTSAE